MKKEMQFLVSIGTNDADQTDRDFHKVIEHWQETFNENKIFQMRYDDCVSKKIGGKQNGRKK